MRELFAVLAALSDPEVVFHSALALGLMSLLALSGIVAHRSGIRWFRLASTILALACVVTVAMTFHSAHSVAAAI